MRRGLVPAARGAPPRTPASQSARVCSRHHLAALGIFIVAFHALGYVLIQRYYANAIPHYDSVGSYIHAFRILNHAAEHGYLAAFGYALKSVLSVTQSLFAAIFSPILSKTPESFHLYTSLSVVAALLAIFTFARGARMSGFGAAALALAYFLPDGLYWWSLGLLDYRRDPGLLGLATATFFLMVTYLRHDRPRPLHRAIGLAFGTVFGLALLARDSAGPYLLGVVVVPAIVLWIARRRSLPLRQWLAVPVWPLAAFAPFLAGFLIVLPQIYARIGDRMLMYGVGDDKWESFVGNALAIPQLVFGTVAIPRSLLIAFALPFGLAPSLVTSILFCLLAAALTVLWWRRAIGVAPPPPVPVPPAQRREAWAMITLGVWIIAFVHLFLSFVVGWRAGQSTIVAIAPYYPALIGVFALAAGLALLFRVHMGAKARLAALVSFMALILIALWVRTESRMPRYYPWMASMHHAIGELRDAQGKMPVFADLWHDNLRLPAIAFYSAQAGKPPPRRTSANFHTAPPPGGPSAIRTYGEKLERAARCQADFIIVTSNLAYYAQKTSPLFLYSRGRPMVEKLLRDLSDRIMYTFGEKTPRPILILDNRDRRACPRGQQMNQ